MIAFEAAAEYGTFLQASPLIRESRHERDENTASKISHVRLVSTCFETVEAADSNNICFWAQKWGVTLMQIKIAAGRAGTRPEDVFAEIAGNAQAI
ncbi:MAG TPA: hypothetical protein VHC39_11355 [Rhizomicrobium sp.]|nr:hypothetical protein [Rhizomicrobium sp.]